MVESTVNCFESLFGSVGREREQISRLIVNQMRTKACEFARKEQFLQLRIYGVFRIQITETSILQYFYTNLTFLLLQNF